MRLSSKVAIVTGAAQGIGKAIALALAAEGANIVVCDVNLEAAEKTAQEIGELGRQTMAVKGNVALYSEVEGFVNKVLDKFGKIDILVNNAGVTRDMLILRMKEADWDTVLSINLKGAFNCTKACSRTMLKQKSGKIVNIASVIGLIGNAGQSNYAASKAGLIGFTKSIAKELAPKGINVNAIAPGFIKTKMTEILSEEVKENLLRQIPLNKLGDPEDVAKAVVFLVSDEASYITGQVITVDGGMVM
ncbi:MAG: 3-oxoacyl-[acyl-carrier-protein] reductase [bacterium]